MITIPDKIKEKVKKEKDPAKARKVYASFVVKQSLLQSKKGKSAGERIDALERAVEELYRLAVS